MWLRYYTTYFYNPSCKQKVWWNFLNESNKTLKIDIFGDFDVSYCGKVFIKTDQNLDNIELELSGAGYITVTSFEIDVGNGDIVFSATFLYLSGRGSFTVGENIVIDSTFTYFDIDEGYISIPDEIKYIVTHIDDWVCNDPEANIKSVKHRLALLLFLGSQRSEEIKRSDFISFIRCIIDSLKRERNFGNCIGGKFERKIEDLFQGIAEEELLTPAIKEYLKKLDAQFISKNKKITE